MDRYNLINTLILYYYSVFNEHIDTTTTFNLYSVIDNGYCKFAIYA